jgi:hypothetical protein
MIIMMMVMNMKIIMPDYVINDIRIYFIVIDQAACLNIYVPHM